MTIANRIRNILLRTTVADRLTASLSRSSGAVSAEQSQRPKSKRGSVPGQRVSGSGRSGREPSDRKSTAAPKSAVAEPEAKSLASQAQGRGEYRTTDTMSAGRTGEEVGVNVGVWQRKLSGFIDRLFVPREIFLRANGEVRFVRLSPRLQKAAALVFVGVFGWVTYASGSFLLHGFILEAKRQEITQHQLAYFDLLTEVNEYHQQFVEITGNLEDNQSYLLTMLQKVTGNDDARLAQIQEQLKTSETEKDRVAVARDGLSGKLKQFEEDLLEIADRNSFLQSQVGAVQDLLITTQAEREQVAESRERLGVQLEQTRARLASVEEERSKLESTLEDTGLRLNESEQLRTSLTLVRSELRAQIESLQGQLTDAAAREERLGGQIGNLEETLAKAVSEGEALAQERDDLNSEIAGLNQRMVDMADAQEEVIERLRERTELSVDAMERTLAMTGLDINQLLTGATAGSSSQGGPFVPVDLHARRGDETSLEISLAMLDLRLDRWSALQDLVRSLPLTMPMNQFRISSGFGLRRDPINGRKARHDGLDFAGPMRSSVYATAPGKVVFAGSNGRYGRMVEIDHGHGIRTRYAHLSKILVEKGQEITHRDKIGLLGNSGRSTGPHLHYEVRFNGKAQDPMKFITAGRFVFKN